jgi:small-conductance mechanosensitive channel
MNQSIPRLVISLAALAAIIFFQDQYNYLTSYTDLPPVFEHTLYRTLIALLVVESSKQVILLFYRTGHPERKRDNFVAGVSHIVTVIYFLLSLVLMLALFNISVKEAFTTLSLIAAAVVLMTKDYISNLITLPSPTCICSMMTTTSSIFRIIKFFREKSSTTLVESLRRLLSSLRLIHL